MEFRDFIRTMLGLRPIATESIINIFRAGRKKGKISEPSPYQTTRVLNWLVVSANWLLIVLTIISLGAIIVMPLVRSDIEVPNLLSQIITLTIGYYSGIISAFIRLNFTSTENISPNNKDSSR